VLAAAGVSSASYVSGATGQGPVGSDDGQLINKSVEQ